MISSSAGLTSSSSSSTLAPAARDPDARPRNRRLLSKNSAAGTSSSTFTSSGHSPTRDASPIPAAHIGSVTGRNDRSTEIAQSRGKSPAASRGLFESSWTPSWASVQDFATSLLGGGGGGGSGSDARWSTSQDVSQTRRSPRRQASYGNVSQRKKDMWGPEPPAEGRPRLQDVAAGPMAEREAALRAIRTASVLESHEGVNCGLDVAGKFKRRNSDEDLRGSTAQEQDMGEHLVYIHHVQPNDTYAGIVLKYKCREDAFRKANGLWSRDGIQIRKWLALPVDACEIRGRPCQGPSSPNVGVDLLARTPEETDPFGGPISNSGYFFTNGYAENHKDHDDDRPWTHVRWVAIDNSPQPIEVARIPRKALGFFPPRRKKSIHTTSTLSTPRGSVDVPSTRLGSDPGVGGLNSPSSSSSRRPSVLSARPELTSSTSRTRVSSVGAGGDDRLKPAWMRRPGGVGSLGRNVRAPGPERDYFNSWTKKHLPGLTMDSLPSMSVMGSERARLGFTSVADETNVVIVESPFADGHKAGSATTGGGAQGTGLDKAAAAIETWLRGAFTKRPGTPVLGPRRGTGIESLEGEGDLIELADTNSDDGWGEASGLADPDGNLLDQEVFGPVGTGWSTSDGGIARGRNTARETAGKDNKKD